MTFETKSFAPDETGFIALGAPSRTRVRASKAPAGNDDKAMLKAAAQLTRDLNRPDARIYWADLLASVLLGYGALVAAILAGPIGFKLAFGAVATLALYRAGSFIHEIAHIKKGDLPYFRLVWNMLVGVPLFAPSFMYEGVHNQHHAKTKFGTIDDPEYLPLASMKPWSLPVFMLFGTLAPVLLLFRFALLAPLSFFSAALRRQVVEKYSGLQINPDFRRAWPEGEFARQFTYQEVGGVLWSWALIGAVVAGLVPVSAFVTFMLVACALMGLNQLRTLVAHLWENDARQPVSVTEQYLDSVNVPPPNMLSALWAPVGLRYHALHHLLPGVPYHNLGKAHRRLSEELEAGSAYHRTSATGLWPLVANLARQTFARR
ncbi:fatty acid desaturase family protein [Sphingomicrobium astaxanthinifaciens]|uniref:fatty acid desaturase family protein n=1 Tax=Sphingomicrobium astaxanthinifaciens TaxID=1227949 RepID=UPI001FCA5842|nr:fatty acid desaturase [Sphingomicrobium astaxanthinifaciens]MCJ7420813.1 fatty acid desaturase [Sphingomicrobium astaxanthinifaciens]